MHGNAVPVLFLYNGNVVPVVFFCILQLLTVILSSLIFISLVGPPLMQFNPLPYVKKWLAGVPNAYDNQLRKYARKRHERKNLAIGVPVPFHLRLEHFAHVVYQV